MVCFGMTKHICTKCQQLRPVEKFQLRCGKPSGQCRECKTENMRQHRLKQGIKPKTFSVLVADQKLCLHCNKMLDLSMFSPSSRGLGGVSAYCRDCFTVRFKSSKEDACKASRAYRSRHRARHLANHRVRMHERRHKIKVSTDGTADTAFLEALYATAQCYYCEQFTKPEDRTADHMLPLSKGGAHSAANLVMACWSCNCGKRDMTSTEFKAKLCIRQR